MRHARRARHHRGLRELHAQGHRADGRRRGAALAGARVRGARVHERGARRGRGRARVPRGPALRRRGRGAPLGRDVRARAARGRGPRARGRRRARSRRTSRTTRSARTACAASCGGRRLDAPHHCSTCQVGERPLPQNVPSPERCPTRQRCVTAFDHHCGIFGRCIAGEGLRGNWKYFVTIISMGLGGMATGVGAVMLGMYWRATTRSSGARRRASRS